MLTADVSGVADADGLTNPGYGYRWVRVTGGSTETELGTASTYRLVSADTGNRVRLEVSLTDDDGNTQTLTARTGTVAANAAPTASNGTVTTAKGAAYAFGAADFGYSDTDGDALASVRIVTLPASGKGSLTLDGSAVSASDTVSAADLGASKLTYTPPANGHGTGYASFTFRVSDGIAESASANTLTVDVTAVPGIPTGVSSTRGDGSVVLAWAAPADVGSNAIVKYQYRVSSDGGASWAVGWTDVPDSDDAGAGLHDETSVTVSDLDNDTTYTFELRAVSAVGFGAEARATAQRATVATQGATALPLTLGTIAGDDVVNIAEKALGFLISGTTGTVSGASLTVTVGATELSATSRANGAWSVLVPADASYIAGESVSVTATATHSRYSDAAAVIRSLGVDLAAPAFRSASVDGASLTVTFSEELGAAASLANSSFSVKKTPAGGAAETVALSADDAPVIDGAAVTLTLASAVASTDSGIEVSYRKPGSGSDNKLADRAGNEAASFADRAVTRSISVAGTPRVTVPNVFRVPARLGVDLGFVRGTEGLGEPSYQWVRVDADGASNPVNVGTGATYRLADADAGKRIKVEVSYGNARGSGATVSSAAWPSSGSVRSRERCNAPVLSGGAVLVGSGRTLAVGSYSNNEGDYWGYYEGGRTGFGELVSGVSYGELKNASFSIGGADYELKAVASADRPGGEVEMYAMLDKDLPADHRRTLKLHVCGVAYAFGKATKHDTHAQYQWPTFLGLAGSAEPTIYLSRDAVAPTVTSATAHGTALTVTFSEELGAADSLLNAAFSVVRTPEGGSEEAVALSADAAPSIDGATVTLTLASAIASTDSGIEVSYTAPDSGSGNRLADRFGNEVAGFAGRAVSHGTADAIPGLSVADAQVREGRGAKLVFTVRLDRARETHVRVDYATRDDTAVAGADYMARSGTLTFARGQTRKTVEVTVLDDAHDEGSETMTFALSNARGARIANGEATGTISNSDPLQKLWLARFGRTVASQTVEALEGRFAIAPDTSPRMTLTIAGQTVDLSRIDDGRALAGTLTGLARAFGAPDVSAANDNRPFARRGIGGAWNEAGVSAPARGMTARELLSGSSFHFTTGDASGLGGAMTGWGKVLSGGSTSSLSGGLSLASETATGVLGMDWERDRLLVGVALSRSVETGSASFAPTGSQYDIEGSVSMVTPYMRVRAGERLSLWSAVGSGSGSLSLSHGGGSQTTDIAMQLAAAGGRAELLRPGVDGGFALALKTDAFFVRSESERVSTPGVGNLAAATGDASRVRAVMEGSRSFALARGGALEPSLSLGLRHDGGDAETGTGVEVGAGLSWSAPAAGLTSDLRLYGLASHEAGGYDEWGASGSLRLAPDSSGRGLSLSMTPSWGAREQAGRLWGAAPGALAGNGGGGQPGGRLDTELGYGLPLSHGMTGTPYAGFGFGEAGARSYRLGWRLASDRLQSFSLDIETTRREAANAAGPGFGAAAEHGIGLRLAARW